MRMSNFETTVTIAEIYGAEWWEVHQDELNRDWEWSFKYCNEPTRFVAAGTSGIIYHEGCNPFSPRIILHRRKPTPPTLREVYGVDEVEIPQGWEWTGEFRKFKSGDSTLDPSRRLVSRWKDSSIFRKDDPPRLILRERPKKVWFKAEEYRRLAKRGDWVWAHYSGWQQSSGGFNEAQLCATRHEETDPTIQTVTQADIDRLSTKETH